MLGVQHKLGGKLQIIHHSKDESISLSDTGKIHTNRGSAGLITLLLPEKAPPGIEYTFALVENYELRIDPQSNKLFADSTTIDDKYYSSLYLGGLMRVCSDKNGDWIVIARYGTWTREA